MKGSAVLLAIFLPVSGVGWLYLESNPARPTPSVEVSAFMSSPAAGAGVSRRTASSR